MTNHYVDSNGDSKACSMCKTNMIYMGQHGYQKYWDCPNDCGPECEELKKPTTHCWVEGCSETNIERCNENADFPYGNRCPSCGASLRNHPTRGEGKCFDQAVHGYHKGTDNG